VTADVVRLEVPAVPDYLALVRMVVAGTARTEPLLDDERVDDLRVIVSEACTNAIEATTARAEAEGGVQPSITVEVRLSSSRIELVVTDEGRGFDPDSLVALPAATDPNRLAIERGLGIPLIRALSDESEISSSSRGTRVRAVLHTGASFTLGTG
jgi:anti-sigma regulatory factor (Ser/Thr protein kinase)